ncbi:hypothetical protein BU14_0322s0004 [Porphyra umbilicalis]|uniref:Uncharacterized protein n=1 Tax=Porphyra umbilicalis TaxID=2786 RepID=A0A1X6NZ30_PORUM|nr:hypothetical protein BU14_0322s0004 [Porphyra umbilicalis]|eukprot:OSX73868.1 hypothetical protein BU14_0322s0004 [Porphyra umbilicalis]
MRVCSCGASRADCIGCVSPARGPSRAWKRKSSSHGCVTQRLVWIRAARARVVRELPMHSRSCLSSGTCSVKAQWRRRACASRARYVCRLGVDVGRPMIRGRRPQVDRRGGHVMKWRVRRTRVGSAAERQRRRRPPPPPGPPPPRHSPHSGCPPPRHVVGARAGGGGGADLAEQPRARKRRHRALARERNGQAAAHGHPLVVALPNLPHDERVGGGEGILAAAAGGGAPVEHHPVCGAEEGG